MEKAYRARALTVVALAVLVASPAFGGALAQASEPIKFDDAQDDNDGLVHRDVSVDGEEERTAVTPVGSGNQNDDPWVGLPISGTHEDLDGPCLNYRWVQLPAEEVEPAVRNAWEAINYLYANVPELQGLRPTEDCPVDPDDELPAPMVREAVQQTVTDNLPRPSPSVPPGYALTGMPAYLVTDHALEYGPVDHQVDLGIMELAVQVNGTGTSTVDWGDGSAPRTYDQPGLPYPDGGVKHTYVDRGNVAITVTDGWRLTFDVYRDGNVIISDVVEFELAPVTLPEPLEVREFRSVRTSTG